MVHGLASAQTHSIWCKRGCRRAIWIPYSMSELMLDVVWSNLKNVLENGPCYRSEAVAGHRSLIDAHGPHGSENGVVAHGSRATSSA